MAYTYSLPTEVAFKGQGMLGYALGPLKQKGLEILYIESEKGHDTFIVSRKITRSYYILSGSGHFTINHQQYPVGPGILVEVPPKVEYSYSGKMTLLCLSIPRWFKGNEIFTKWNPDVFGRESPCVGGDMFWSARLARVSIFGKSLFNAWLRLSRWLWMKAPASVTSLGAIGSYGQFSHRLVRTLGLRQQSLQTFFLRNRPKLELIQRLIARKKMGDTLTVTVLGCSTGAEAYSVAWKIRSARPDLRLALQGVDLSEQAVEFAQRGVYSLAGSPLTCRSIFGRLTPVEMDELFERDGELLTVKSWIKEGLSWRVGDAGDAETIDLLGPQDLVLANNFLCDMEAKDADRCLRNIAHLVRSEGYLLVSGVDLDIRAAVARDLGWKPLPDLLEEIHEGDPSLRGAWPWHYSGLEPLNKRKRDWQVRFAAAFQLPSDRANRIHV